MARYQPAGFEEDDFDEFDFNPSNDYNYSNGLAISGEDTTSGDVAHVVNNHDNVCLVRP